MKDKLVRKQQTTITWEFNGTMYFVPGVRVIDRHCERHTGDNRVFCEEAVATVVSNENIGKLRLTFFLYRQFENFSEKIQTLVKNDLAFLGDPTSPFYSEDFVGFGGGEVTVDMESGIVSKFRLTLRFRKMNQHGLCYSAMNFLHQTVAAMWMARLCRLHTPKVVQETFVQTENGKFISFSEHLVRQFENFY
jgi:hypothetical protein